MILKLSAMIYAAIAIFEIASANCVESTEGATVSMEVSDGANCGSMGSTNTRYTTNLAVGKCSCWTLPDDMIDFMSFAVGAVNGNVATNFYKSKNCSGNSSSEYFFFRRFSEQTA
jgi:hypothetical protein